MPAGPDPAFAPQTAAGVAPGVALQAAAPRPAGERRRSSLAAHPTGKSLNPVQPPLQKYFRLRLTQISSLSRTVPSHRGALRNVINAGRDAVDADGALDELRLRWTAKSCGPDAPTLESSRWRQLRRRRWQKSPVTGESTKETVKTIAQGRPGVPVNLW
jgi:hypothetical protein